MSNNLGKTSIQRRRQKGNSMQKFDALPAPLRKWLSEAVLPWSPTSVYRIWRNLTSQGINSNEALKFISKAEKRTLSKENLHKFHEKQVNK